MSINERQVLIGGNWKCNGTLAQADEILSHLNSCGPLPSNAEVVIAVPSIHLIGVKSKIRNDMQVASQDIGLNPGFGAYTGEISAKLLNDIGILWSIVGHSERRAGFGFPGEPDEVVGLKVMNAINNGLKVIACVGEQLSERESGETMSVVSRQLQAIASKLTAEQWQNVVIAYEPVWAIGTGKVATPDQAEETHKEIRQWISVNVSIEVALQTRILYGGSVKGSNATSLISCENIDGFLVGGASLLPEFVDIIMSTAK